MYLFYVLVNLLYWWALPSPTNLTVAAVWVGCVAAEVYLQSRYEGQKHKRRRLTYVAVCMCAACEVALWYIGQGLGTAIYISYHIAAAAMIASIVGKVGYAVMERLRVRREKKGED